MSRRCSGARGGFTIVEMVVSLVLLTICLSTFMTVSKTTSRLSQHHAYLSQALTIGEQVTEELLMMSGRDGNLSVGTHERFFDRHGYETTSGSHTFKAEWVVSNYTDVPGVLRVDVSLEWQGEDDLETVQWTTYRK